MMLALLDHPGIVGGEEAKPSGLTNGPAALLCARPMSSSHAPRPMAAQQLRQLGDVRRDPPRLITRDWSLESERARSSTFNALTITPGAKGSHARLPHKRSAPFREILQRVFR